MKSSGRPFSYSDPDFSPWIENDLPIPVHPEKQREWDRVLCSTSVDALELLLNQHRLVSFNATLCAESGSWLHCLPNSKIDTLWDNEMLRHGASFLATFANQRFSSFRKLEDALERFQIENGVQFVATKRDKGKNKNLRYARISYSCICHPKRSQSLNIRRVRLTFKFEPVCSTWCELLSNNIDPVLTSIESTFTYHFRQFLTSEIPEHPIFQDWRRCFSSQLNHHAKELHHQPQLTESCQEELLVHFEFQRMKFGHSWRVSDVNRDFRSPLTGAVIMRCAQPRVGIIYTRNEYDEAFVRSVLESCREDPGSKAPKVPQRLLIIDARLVQSAYLNRLVGGGYEHPDYYEQAEVYYAQLPNIHVVRDAFNCLLSLVSRPSLPTDDAGWQAQLDKTGWLQLTSNLIKTALSAACDLVVNSRSIMIHCSDGWDRTPQLTALIELLVDPFYRTVKGFQLLVNREWFQFGHKFADRSGCGFRVDVELSPIFIQWLDCVYQLWRQFPHAFEFNESFLLYLKPDCRLRSLALWDSLYTSAFEPFSNTFAQLPSNLFSQSSTNHQPADSHIDEDSSGDKALSGIEQPHLLSSTPPPPSMSSDRSRSIELMPKQSSLVEQSGDMVHSESPPLLSTASLSCKPLAILPLQQHQNEQQHSTTITAVEDPCSAMLLSPVMPCQTSAANPHLSSRRRPLRRRRTSSRRFDSSCSSTSDAIILTSSSLDCPGGYRPGGLSTCCNNSLCESVLQSRSNSPCSSFASSSLQSLGFTSNTTTDLVAPLRNGLVTGTLLPSTRCSFVRCSSAVDFAVSSLPEGLLVDGLPSTLTKPQLDTDKTVTRLTVNSDAALNTCMLDCDDDQEELHDDESADQIDPFNLLLLELITTSSDDWAEFRWRLFHPTPINSTIDRLRWQIKQHTPWTCWLTDWDGLEFKVDRTTLMLYHRRLEAVKRSARLFGLQSELTSVKSRLDYLERAANEATAMMKQLDMENRVLRTRLSQEEKSSRQVATTASQTEFGRQRDSSLMTNPFTSITQKTRAMSFSSSCNDSQHRNDESPPIDNSYSSVYWQPNHLAHQCNLCSQSFWLFRQRHHCRCCGYIICDSCSSKRLVLPQLMYNRPVRVCDRCVEQLATTTSRDSVEGIQSTSFFSRSDLTPSSPPPPSPRNQSSHKADRSQPSSPIATVMPAAASVDSSQEELVFSFSQPIPPSHIADIQLPLRSRSDPMGRMHSSPTPPPLSTSSNDDDLEFNFSHQFDDDASPQRQHRQSLQIVANNNRFIPRLPCPSSMLANNNSRSSTHSNPFACTTTPSLSVCSDPSPIRHDNSTTTNTVANPCCHRHQQQTGAVVNA